MSKSKFVLTPNPTFKATVMIPVHGDMAAPVEFTFKHRSREQYREMFESWKEKEDEDAILDMASGWDLSDPFDKESIAKMLQNYMGAFKAILETYQKEMTGSRLGN